MKYLILSLALLAACNSRPQSDATQTGDSATTLPADAAPAEAAPLSARLQSLSLTADHDWQQVNLGDDFAAAKATTTVDPFEQDAQHIGYSHEFDNLESVDWQFFQENGKVSKIQVDLYLNTAQSVADYQNDLATYLTARYGTPATAGPTTTWQNGSVVLKNVSKAKDFGLRLELSGAGKR